MSKRYSRRRPPAAKVAGALLWGLAAGSTCGLAVLLGLQLYLLHSLVGLGLPIDLYLAALRPALFLAAGATLLIMAARQERAPSWLLGLTTLALLAALPAVAGYSRWSGVRPELLGFLALAAGLGAGLALIDRLLGKLPRPVFWSALPALLIVFSLWWLPLRDGESLNELGLIAEKPTPPDSPIIWSYSKDKDNYPDCEFHYNSLGFRDIEPDINTLRPQRVLLVGDSFVWGDGIPTQEETLGHQLREQLELLAPGRFEVTSAAYPGLNLYGYRRFVMTLQPLLRSTIVVISYLGESDYLAIDAQSLVDATPGDGIVRALMMRLRVRQSVHEASTRMWSRLSLGSRGHELVDRMMAELKAHSLARGYRAIVLTYIPEEHPSTGGLESIVLPFELRYPGHANDLWYGLDFHPKPALNKRISELLAHYLAAPLETHGLQ